MKRIISGLLLFTFLFILSSCVESVTPPEEPERSITNPVPANGGTAVSGALTLSWKPANLSRFTVYLDKQNPPVKIYAQDTAATSIVALDIKPGATYYWKVNGKDNSGKTVEGDVWSFTASQNAGPGYAMKLHRVSEALPSYVNVQFQAFDLSGKGITNLTKDDFIIYENGRSISQTEASAIIYKKEKLNYTLKTVLMLDNSSSLADSLDYLKDAAVEFINAMDANQEIALYIFSDKTELLIDFTSDKQRLINAVTNITNGYTSTNLYGAVVEGASRLKEFYSPERNEQSALVLFTDGSDTEGRTSFSQAKNAVSGKNVYTVGLGSEIEPEALRQIGSGGFYAASAITGLNEKFREVQEDLKNLAGSFYLLNYMSPKRGNEDNSLKIYIKDNPYVGPKSFISAVFSSKDFYSVKPGLFVNSDKNNPEGINELALNSGASAAVYANTFMSVSMPVYEWSSSNESMIAITTTNENGSQAVIKASGPSGNTVKVTVTDKANNLSKIFEVIIK